MSIASEYAKIARQALFYPEGWSVPAAEIALDGDLRMKSNDLSPVDALALAAWIFDTFKDEPWETK